VVRKNTGKTRRFRRSWLGHVEQRAECPPNSAESEVMPGVPDHILVIETSKMTMREYSGSPPSLGRSRVHDVALPVAPVMRAAEARMAIECLQRAEEWAAGVDNDIVADMVVIHERLLRWIANPR
jgi:hypothetical protein